MIATSARTPQAAPATAARRFPGGPRLAWLHLRSRRVPAGVLALALCGGLLRAALRFNWTFNSGRYAQLVPMIIAAGAATLIAMTAHSPFGEAERPTGRWLPYLRLGTAAGMTAAAVGLLQLGVVGMSLNEGVLVLARGAWICACLCLAAGLLLFTIRGPRIGPSDDEA